MADTRVKSPAKGDASRRKSRGPLKLGPKEPPRRSPKAWAAAVAIHVAVGAIVVQITFGHGLDGFFNFDREAAVEERITWVPAPKQKEPERAKRKPAPATEPVQRKPSTRPVVVPGQPATPVPTPPVTADTGGSATTTSTVPTVGGVTAELRGVQPGYTDPRIWGAPPLNYGRATRSGADRLDSVVSVAIITAIDSVEAIARRNGEGGRRPGDWTRRDKNGDKWGWDEGGIRLGKVTIPNALLMLLPMNVQQSMSANPTSVDRERRLALARQDIQYNAQSRIGEDGFKKLVEELRDRKEREYQERQKAKQKPKVIGQSGSDK